METHAHHLHKAPGKGFKHYFFEFFMLFLAVFCGFLAENIRENIAEDNRAKEYAISLVQDLQNDTAAIHSHKKTTLMYLAIADSMISLSQTRLEGRNAARFSFYTRFSYWTQAMVWNRATFEQIKNSGSLRYFKNHALLEKIMKYDGAIQDIESESHANQVRGSMLLNQINAIMDPVYHQKLSHYYLYEFDKLSAATIESLYPANPESLENKRNEIRELLNMIVVQQRNLQRNIDVTWKQAEEMAVELISELKKEYHLE
jgi:hypothetical protein